jgi:TetR/AcrR family transcriptional repressor of mexJK operon
MLKSKLEMEGPERRGGRPSKEQAERITDQIIDVATHLFLETSFEATSIDLIVAKARISKQTFYARFVSKEALYAAVIRKGLQDFRLPRAERAGSPEQIDVALTRIGIELAKRSRTPAALALHRLVASEAHQFPEVALAYYETGIQSRGLITSIFSNAMGDHQIRSTDAHFLAEQFLYAIVEGPARELGINGRIGKSEKELQEWVTAAVALFLSGCRGPSPR